MTELDTIKLLCKVKTLCMEINESEKECKGSVEELLNSVEQLSAGYIQHLQPHLITAFIPLIQKGGDKYREDYKIEVANTLSKTFSKSRLDKSAVYFNINTFLVKEIFEPNSANPVKNVSEEYKLAIIRCMCALNRSLSWDLLPEIYIKENIFVLTTILSCAVKLTKHEKLKSLRIAAIECILTLMKLENTEDLNDLELRLQISNMFIYFLPGLASRFLNICVEDEKTGHKVVLMALRAWGRSVSLLMQNYDGIDSTLNVFQAMDIAKESKETKREPLKTFEDVHKYVDVVKRTPKWYQTHDFKLEICVNVLSQLATHSHLNVRKELLHICDLLIQHCFSTMPKTITRIIEILSVLSVDEYEEISIRSTSILNETSTRLLEEDFQTKIILDYIEQNFYNSITKIPRIFNGIDEREQIMALNVLIGYLQVFGQHKLKQVLFTHTNLNRLILSLIHVAQLEKSDISLLEEYRIQDFESSPDRRTPWKSFRFHDQAIQKKLEQICKLLAQPEVSNIVLDYLIDVFINDLDNRKEATLLLNEILSCPHDHNIEQIKNMIHTYLDVEYWDLPMLVLNEGHKKCSLAEVQNNIVQLCLQLEGIGKMALVLERKFEPFLLKVLYLVLEKAGSSHPLLSAAGLSSITNISIACGYKSVTELINKNTDYISYNVSRKLRREEHNENVLNVFGVIMKYSTMDVLTSLSDIIEGVLMQSCDKYLEKNINAYLRVFAIFIKCLHKWLDIAIDIPAMKTKQEKEKEMEDLRLSNLEEFNNDFSDDIMGKSAEEMYQEDMAKSQKELEEEIEPASVEEYKKPDPPMHIKLTVSILKRSSNFLPSKDPERKIIVLEILKDGVEILRDWEDELLPIVHAIWSPLVQRFKEFTKPLIINLSFQLLVTLARLSKDFIRMRTIKEVLPSLSDALQKQSKESYLKDVGSAYRYSQGYKMQIAILPQLAKLFYDLDVSHTYTSFIAAIDPYLSNRQPKILQEAAIDFCKTIACLDNDLGTKIILELSNKHTKEKEWTKNTEIIKDLIRS